MSDERMKSVLSAYGADPRRWPTAEAAHLSHAADAADLAEAAALDRLLDTHVVPAPGADLVGRVLAGAPRRGSFGARVRPFWLPGAGLAAACAVGIVAGLGIGAWLPSSADRDSATAAGLAPQGPVGSAIADGEIG